MILVNPIVISEKIYNNHPLLRTKSFAASLGVHASLFLAVAYFVSTHPIIVEKPQEHIVISLSDFTEHSGDIHKMESFTSPVNQPKKEKQHIKESNFQPTSSPKMPTKTFQETQSLSPSVSPEASAPLASTIPMPASSPRSKSNDSPHQATSSSPVHELPKTPPAGNDISGAALGHIRAMIEKAIIYPTIARKLRLEGIVTVFFMLNSDGTVDKVKINSTSGSKILDEKAIQTILSLSGDYPILGKTVELSIPIAFELNH